jgi:hypothetical protein
VVRTRSSSGFTLKKRGLEDASTSDVLAVSVVSSREPVSVSGAASRKEKGVRAERSRPSMVEEKVISWDVELVREKVLSMLSRERERCEKLTEREATDSFRLRLGLGASGRGGGGAEGGRWNGARGGRRW